MMQSNQSSVQALVTAKQANGMFPALFRTEPEIHELFGDLLNEGIGTFDLDMTEMPDKEETTWKMPGPSGCVYSAHYDGILLKARQPRAYWSTGFGTGGNKAPDCRSDNGVRGAGNPGGDCSSCPLSQYGSDPKGTGGQACRQRGLLFFLRPGAELPEVLQIHRSSLGVIRRYRLAMLKWRKAPTDVVTRATLVTAHSKAGGIAYPLLVLTILGQLDQASAAAAHEKAAFFAPIFEKVTMEGVIVDQERVQYEGWNAPQYYVRGEGASADQGFDGFEVGPDTTIV